MYCCQDSCLEILLSGCPQSITIRAKLGANKTYYVFLTDVHGNRYTSKIITDIEGTIVLDTTLFSKIMSSVSPGVILEVSENDQDFKPELMSIGEEPTKCLFLKFSNTTPKILQPIIQ